MLYAHVFVPFEISPKIVYVHVCVQLVSYSEQGVNIAIEG